MCLSGSRIVNYELVVPDPPNKSIRVGHRPTVLYARRMRHEVPLQCWPLRVALRVLGLRVTGSECRTGSRLSVRPPRIERHHRRWRKQAGDDDPTAVGGPVWLLIPTVARGLVRALGPGVAIFLALVSHNPRSPYGHSL